MAHRPAVSPCAKKGIIIRSFHCFAFVCMLRTFQEYAKAATSMGRECTEDEKWDIGVKLVRDAGELLRCTSRDSFCSSTPPSLSPTHTHTHTFWHRLHSFCDRTPVCSNAGDARSAQRLEESRNNHYRLRRILEVVMQPSELYRVCSKFVDFIGVSSIDHDTSCDVTPMMQRAGDNADGPSHAGRHT